MERLYEDVYSFGGFVERGATKCNIMEILKGLAQGVPARIWSRSTSAGPRLGERMLGAEK